MGNDHNAIKPATYYYHPDHLGSTGWMTDQNGKVHEHVEYYPYGEVWREPKNDNDGKPAKLSQSFLFSGKEFDEETGLYYFGKRYYDPRLVRWATGDPSESWSISRDPWKLSRYAYSQWSPERYSDPDGADPVESRILENPISVENLERAGLLDSVSLEYLQQKGLLRAAIGQLGGQMDPEGPSPETEQLVLFSLGITSFWGFVVSALPATPAISAAEAGYAASSSIRPEASAATAETGTIREGIYEFKGQSGKDYVGQSGDINSRLGQHLRSGKLPEENVGTVRRTEVLGGKTVREIAEQRRINAKGGIEKLENKVNPIGPKRQHLLKE